MPHTGHPGSAPRPTPCTSLRPAPHLPQLRLDRLQLLQHRRVRGRRLASLLQVLKGGLCLAQQVPRPAAAEEGLGAAGLCRQRL